MIILKFDSCLSSAAETPVKFHNNVIILTPNIQPSRLCEILRYHVLLLNEKKALAMCVLFLSHKHREAS